MIIPEMSKMRNIHNADVQHERAAAAGSVPSPVQEPTSPPAALAPAGRLKRRLSATDVEILAFCRWHGFIFNANRVGAFHSEMQSASDTHARRNSRAGKPHEAPDLPDY